MHKNSDEFLFSVYVVTVSKPSLTVFYAKIGETRHLQKQSHALSNFLIE